MNALKLSPFSITYDLFVIWHTRNCGGNCVPLEQIIHLLLFITRKYAINWVRWRPIMRKYDLIRFAHKSDSITIFEF